MEIYLPRMFISHKMNFYLQILGYSWINSSEFAKTLDFIVIRFKRSALIRVVLFPSYFLDRNRHGLRSTRTGSYCRCNNLRKLEFTWLDSISMWIIQRRFFSHWRPKGWQGGIVWSRILKPWKPSALRRPFAPTRREHSRRTAWPWLTFGLMTLFDKWIPANPKRVSFKFVNCFTLEESH